jgi:hypothetical protein
VAGGKLKRIDLGGGSPITLCDSNQARGGTWSEDGVILFSSQLAAVQRIPASGGTPSPVTKLNREAGESAHYYPQFLPGEQQFLYLVRYRDPEQGGIFIGSLDGKPATRILQTQYRATYDAGSGRLLYTQGNGTLMARRLELDPPRLTGNPAVVAERISMVPNNGFADFSLSANGTLFYGAGTGLKEKFGWRDRAGKLLGMIGEPFEARQGRSFRISPDQSRVAYLAMAGGAQSDVWILEIGRGLSTRVTFGDAQSSRWSPDGKHIYYSDNRGIFRKAADGSGEEELVLKGSVLVFVHGISPDGRYLFFNESSDIWKLPLMGERKPEPYLQTKYTEQYGSFSPDGRWVAYSSNESGRSEVYIQGFPERRGKWLVSADGGVHPAWRGDGKELSWRSANGVLMAASMDLQASAVRPGKPEPLFHLTSYYFDAARDGQRFLVLEPERGSQPDPPMVVVQNWAARLGTQGQKMGTDWMP